MGTLLVVLVYLGIYGTAVILAARLRNLRKRSVTWTGVMLALPVLLFPLGFLSPVLWAAALLGAAVYALVVLGKELRLRKDYLARIGVGHDA